MGPNIKKDHLLEGNIHVEDIAPTLLYSLDLKSNPLWTGKIVNDAFKAKKSILSTIMKNLRKFFKNK